MRRSSAITALLSITLVLALMPAPVAVGATRAELRAHEQAARDARKAAAAAQAAADRLSREVAALDKTIASTTEAVQTLSSDVASATTRTQRLQAEVNALQLDAQERQRDIELTQAELDRQNALLAERVTATYKDADFMYLELLLEAHDIQDFVARTALVQRIISSNEQVASDLKDTRIAIEKAKAAIEQDMLAIDTKRAEAQAEENHVRGLRAQQQTKLNQQKTAQDQKDALVAENEANAARLLALAESEEAESNRIASELFGTGSGYFAGVMKFPVPGWEQIPKDGSAFGWRIHPIFHTRKFHKGIDISTSGIGPRRPPNGAKNIAGAAIVAAGDGTVVSAGYRGGYGNTVIIDHGNGVYTIYAHQQDGGIKVSVGDRVRKGQRIGTVGSTGYSTGPHLHFEVRVNGQPVDPMKYLR